MKMNNPYFTKLLVFQISETKLKDDETDIECYILYEYGVCTLSNYMEIPEIRKWSEEEGLSFLKEIIGALNSLHEKRILHLDIKLSNIVIDESMKRFKFIDYGCCYELPGIDRGKMYKIPICGTKRYVT